MLRYAFIAAVCLSAPAYGHGGGLDAKGCHNDRKRGGYHCHRAQAGGQAQPLRMRSLPTRSTGAAYYPNCASARAAGAAPIREGEGGYNRRLDRDGDGVACE